MPIRVEAFLIHLAISAAVVAAVLFLVFAVWYPAPFAHLENVYPVAITLIGVDLVVGPLLTLVVYKPGKRGLKLDLGLIALLQVGALIGGLYVSFNSRPIWAVYADGKFYAVNKEEYAKAELDKLPPGSPYGDFSMTGPRWVASKLPENASRADKYYAQFASAIGGGARLLPRFYQPYEALAAEAARAGKRVADISFAVGAHAGPKPEGFRDAKPPASARQIARVQSWLKELDRPSESVVLLPLIGTTGSAIVALDASSGKVLATLAEDPWWTY